MNPTHKFKKIFYGASDNLLIQFVRYLFNNSKFRNRIVEFLFFAAIGVVGLGFNDLLIWLFTDCIGTHYMFSKIVAAAMVYLWNFFARKYLVFK